MTNLLGVVRALANHTETQGKTAEEYKSAFLGRFEALMKSHSFMTAEGGQIELKDLVMDIVGGLGGDRLQLAGGPTVLVTAAQIAPLTMILHELGTNALKYGAFSGEGGVAQISWRIVPEALEKSVELTLRERCSSPVSPPVRSGSGTAVIQNSASLGLHGGAELKFESEGLDATVVFPLKEGP